MSQHLQRKKSNITPRSFTANHQLKAKKAEKAGSRKMQKELVNEDKVVMVLFAVMHAILLFVDVEKSTEKPACECKMCYLYP